MIALRGYQEDAVKALLNGKHVVVAGTGLGKGFISLEWARRTGKPNVLVVTQASKVKSNDFPTEAELLDEGWKHSLSSFSVVSWNSLAKWLDAHSKNNWNEYTIIFDECFPYDTLVKTDRGEVKIGELKVGDKVVSYNEQTKEVELKKVTRTIKKKAPEEMLRIHTTNGTIISTKNHPYYTGNGYTIAEELKEGDTLYEMPLLWDRDSAKEQKSKIRLKEKRSGREESVLLPQARTGTKENRWSVFKDKKVWSINKVRTLWKRDKNFVLDAGSKATGCKWNGSVLFERMCTETPKSDIVEKDDRRKSSLEGRCERKNSGDEKAKGDTADMGIAPRTERRKRSLYRTANKTIGNVEPSISRMDNGTTSSTRREARRWVSDLLQIRYWKRILQNRNRMRWGESQFFFCEKTRREERQQISGIRVESIEVLKLGDIKRRRLYSEPDYVYCIDVEDNHNFFANNVLVHNCQRCKNYNTGMGKSFRKIADNTSCWAGFTATPGESWIQLMPYFVATGKVKNKTTFTGQFCEIATYKGFPEIVRYLNVPVLQQWWNEITYFPDTKDTERQLPAETHKMVRLKVPTGYTKVLKTRKRLDNDEFLETSMAMCHYLRQLCATKEKLEWLREFVEGLGTRCVVFYTYIEEGEKIKEQLKGVKIWEINGKKHEIPTADTIGETDVVLAQWESGSASLNLQFINYWVSFSPCYSLTTSVQARGRIKRIGQTKKMFYYYLWTDRTIEEDIYKCLKGKKDFSAETWYEQKFGGEQS